MHGIERRLKDRIIELLENFPAVALLGPRQCGKTTPALDIMRLVSKPSIYLDLERVGDLRKLEDAVGYLELLEDSMVVMDDVQTRPGLFPELRGLIDSGRRKGIRSGRFLFLGSASYELLRQSGESLAGRIAYLELTPFRCSEVEPEAVSRLWVRGGFPDSFLATSESFSREWRRNFIDTYLARDLNMLGSVGPLPAMRDLMRMTSHLHGQVLNIATLIASHEFNRPAINGYLDLFEQTFVIRRLAPFLPNVGKRLTKRPKIYVRDSGLLHQLLGIADDDALRGHPVRGASWEGFVIGQIISLLPNWEPYFYRTSNGAELDLVMVLGDRKLGFEIKVATAPKLSKGFYQALSDIKPEASFVVSRTDEVWSGGEAITHTPMEHLPELLKSYL
jgi:hypothetical protein